MKYRKKPVVIEAIQWDGTPEKRRQIEKQFPALKTFLSGDALWMIETLEGNHIVSRDDWVIKGVKDECYPCKPDIFFMTYEAVR